MAFVQSGNRLFYYCKLKTALELILPDSRLLLNKIGKSNDPRENKSFVFAAIAWEGNGFENLMAENEEITKILRSDGKMICFSQDYKSSFFGYESSRMWTYYGGNHEGVCLLLDKEEFLKENESKINRNLLKEIFYYEFDIEKPIEVKSVDHAQMKSIGKEKYLKDIFRPTQLEYLYYTKNIEWESEREIRLMHFSDKEENEKEYCDIEKSLKHIYVGIDFHKSYLPSIVNLKPNIDVCKMEYKGVKLIPKPLYSDGKYITNEL